jgi:rhomboid protease GluP
MSSPNEEKPRKSHPLERPAPPPRPAGGEGSSQRGTLHIPLGRPIATNVLIGINALVFVVMFFLVTELQRADAYAWGATNKIAVLEEGEFHRLFTAMFLHANIAHIFFNMYALWAIGQTVEAFFGTPRYVLIYFLGGLGGSVLSVIFNPASVVSVGASGAVFAIFGAQIVFLYKHRKLFGEMAQRQLRQLIIIGGINFAYGILTSFSDTGVSIDNWGHLGGLLGGMLITWYLGPLFMLQRKANTETNFEAVDVNPLEQNYQAAIAYFSGLLLLLIIATVLT